MSNVVMTPLTENKMENASLAEVSCPNLGPIRYPGVGSKAAGSLAAPRGLQGTGPLDEISRNRPSA